MTRRFPGVQKPPALMSLVPISDSSHAGEPALSRELEGQSAKCGPAAAETAAGKEGQQ
jgi:hypothetical protein